MSASRASFRLVELDLWQHMESIEKRVKAEGISTTEDVNDLALECFNELKEKMSSYQESHPLCEELVVGGIEVYFLPNSRIAKDLKKHQANPQASFTPTWRELCQRKDPPKTVQLP